MNHDEHAKRAEELLERVDEKPAQRAHLIPEAQLHATLAVYQALILPSYGMSIGDERDFDRSNRQ